MMTKLTDYQCVSRDFAYTDRVWVSWVWQFLLGFLIMDFSATRSQFARLALFGFAAAILSATAMPVSAQDYERRDPRPEYDVLHLRPSSPTLVRRWDARNGLLNPAGATMDASTPYSAAPSAFFEFRSEGSQLVTHFENANGLPPNVYQVYVVAKAERVVGPLTITLKNSYVDGSSEEPTYLMESKLSKFDWRTFVFEISNPDLKAPRLSGVDVILNARGTGRVWIGAVELVNLGLPERHPFFQEDRYGPGN